MIEVEKEIVRDKKQGTPRLYFDKKLFDAVWGKDVRIPVIIQIVSKNEIRILRKVEKEDRVKQRLTKLNNLIIEKIREKRTLEDSDLEEILEELKKILTEVNQNGVFKD